MSDVFGYADPPYKGHQRYGHYKHDPRCAEVDHVKLVEQMERASYKGWALSLSPRLRSRKSWTTSSRPGSRSAGGTTA